ncbi:MAG: glycosyltransferase, partial [Vitreimonas sp.]
MRALFLHHPYTRARFEQDFVDRIAELPDVDVARADLDALAEGRLASPDRDIALGRWDAVVIFVAFTALRKAQPLRWSGFQGLRVLFDHDIIQNYSDLFDPALFGLWPDVFHRHRFDSMITSGRAVQQRLAGDGIAADWVAKGFEPGRFTDCEGPREGVVSYGSAYACRVAAERTLAEAGLPLSRIAMTPYVELGNVLSRFLACMAVSSDLCVPLERRPQLSATPARDVPMQPGLEPMAKFFEAAGAGCCPIADAMDDLEGLGFRHGETAILFRTHAELV